MGEDKANTACYAYVVLKVARVSFTDVSMVKHATEVRAESLYDAIATALQLFRDHQIYPGLNTSINVEIVYSMEHSIDMYRLLNWARTESVSGPDGLLKERMSKALGDWPRTPPTR